MTIATTIVPFGKYKGQPVEVLAHDEEYCRWLADQDWFRTRFATIHTLIVNNFAAPHDTPEHNALQARFLDVDWCQSFALASGWTGSTVEALNACWKFAQRYAEQCRVEFERNKSSFVAQVERLQTEWTTASDALDPLRDRLLHTTWTFSAKSAFEVEGVDVRLLVDVSTDDVFPEYYEAAVYPRPSWVGRGTKETPLHQQGLFSIECKPLVGDDYPAILRQMKTVDAKYLLAEDVRSRTVSLAQIRQIFRSADIQILTVADVTALALKWPIRCSKEHA
jgi:hypothetical protein